MAPSRLSACVSCGIRIDPERFRCVLCGARVDRPSDFQNKDAVFSYFSRGGALDIALAARAGALLWDDSDDFYLRVVEQAIGIALEHSLASMDLLFFRSHPSTGAPWLGIKWPTSGIVEGVRFSAWEGDHEVKYTNLPRSSTSAGDVGVNYRLDAVNDDPNFSYGVALFTSVNVGSSRKKLRRYETVVSMFTPVDPGQPNGLHRLCRRETKIPVSLGGAV